MRFLQSPGGRIAFGIVFFSLLASAGTPDRESCGGKLFGGSGRVDSGSVSSRLGGFELVEFGWAGRSDIAIIELRAGSERWVLEVSPARAFPDDEAPVQTIDTVVVASDELQRFFERTGCNELLRKIKAGTYQGLLRQSEQSVWVVYSETESPAWVTKLSSGIESAMQAQIDRDSKALQRSGMAPHYRPTISSEGEVRWFRSYVSEFEDGMWGELARSAVRGSRI